ncbi:hypothetical protein TNCV_3569551 [Trichonephila clavipes]|nr:hypothetical protein TNCV_3569551 [Trichonephila clavipes]
METSETFLDLVVTILKTVILVAMVSMLMLGKIRPLPGHKISGSMKREMVFILECLHPPRSPTREAVCRSSGKHQARRLPEVHPEYIVLQHQDEDPTGKPTSPYLQH